jgi:hypothetical protein
MNFLENLVAKCGAHDKEFFSGHCTLPCQKDPTPFFWKKWGQDGYKSFETLNFL